MAMTVMLARVRSRLTHAFDGGVGGEFAARCSQPGSDGGSAAPSQAAPSQHDPHGEPGRARWRRQILVLQRSGEAWGMQPGQRRAEDDDVMMLIEENDDDDHDDDDDDDDDDHDAHDDHDDEGDDDHDDDDDGGDYDR